MDNDYPSTINDNKRESMYFQDSKKFEISVSTQAYSDKNLIKWNSVKYQRQSIAVEEFGRLIKEGYCFCHSFKTKGLLFGLSEKKDANFLSADMVFVDIDDSDIEMNDLVSRLSKKPTLCYTTPNNHTEKSNYKYRFRLCYLFSLPIYTVETYHSLYDGIAESIRKDIQAVEIKDNCGRTPSQQFSGNAKAECELYVTDNVFSHSDFPYQSNNVSSSLSISNGKLLKSAKKDNDVVIEVEDLVIADRGFISDVNSLSPYDLIDKYKPKYNYFTHTELHYQDGYALIPSDYQEIYRQTYMDSFIKDNGDEKKFSAVKKLRDGDNRRKKLYIAGLIMKKILPSITFEHLLYNLICERTYYYDNSDKALTNKVLSNIARNVMNTPLEKIQLQSKRKKRKFEVDKSYCALHGISPNAMKNIVRKMLKDEEIGDAYDCSLSVSENLAVFKKMGINVGKSKLYRWCKENGINTKGMKEKVCNHDPYAELKEFTHYYFCATTLKEKGELRIIINKLRKELSGAA